MLSSITEQPQNNNVNENQNVQHTRILTLSSLNTLDNAICVSPASIPSIIVGRYQYIGIFLAELAAYL